MAHITRDEVLKLASLSAMTLDDAEVDSLRTDIENILGYVNQLSELDTSTVEPTYQVTDLANVTRPDEIIDYKTSREDLLNLAPETIDTSVKVPKVL
jgi:aspartyl-tRNA(Asn)/glutamyl-tRNA(Gln) amidotransferase subunit C